MDFAAVALLLEQNERAVSRRYMSLDSLATVCHDHELGAGQSPLFRSNASNSEKTE